MPDHAEALRAVMALIDDGLLVRNVTNDGHFPSYLSEATRIVKVIAAAREALATQPPQPGGDATALRERYRQIEARLTVFNLGIHHPETGPAHTPLNHRMEDCPHVQCVWHTAQYRLIREDVPWLLALVAQPPQSEMLREIQARHEDFERRYSPGPDWEPFNQTHRDRGYLLALLAAQPPQPEAAPQAEGRHMGRVMSTRAHKHLWVWRRNPMSDRDRANARQGDAKTLRGAIATIRRVVNTTGKSAFVPRDKDLDVFWNAVRVIALADD